MFEDDIFEEWLDSESRKVLEKFKNNEHLTVEDKMVLTLKAQTNHFYHLDKDIRQDIALLKEDADKRFEQVDKRFEQMNGEIKKIYIAINNQTWKMIGAIGLIVILGKLIDSF